MALIHLSAASSVMWGDTKTRIPVEDDSVDAVCSSHIIGHLHYDKVHLFLGEVRRILRPWGVISIVTPDLRKAC